MNSSFLTRFETQLSKSLNVNYYSVNNNYSNNTQVNINKIKENINEIHLLFIKNFNKAHSFINNNYNNKECNIILDIVGDYLEKYELHNITEKQIKMKYRLYNIESLKSKLTYDIEIEI
jgi:hypothetical protein